MKKLLCTIIFIFVANYASAQNYFTTTTSATNSNSNLSHFGTFTLGSTYEGLNDPWRLGEGRLLELYKPSGNVSLRLGNAFGKLSFSVAGHNGAFFPSAQNGDIVIRKHTANKVYFSLNSSNGTGNGAFIFGDSSNLSTLSILNNGKVGIGTSNPKVKLHVGGAGSVFRVGPNYGSSDRDFIDLKAHGTDTRITSSNERFHIENINGPLLLQNNGANVGIGTSNPDEKLTVKGKVHAEEVKVDLSVPPDYVFQKYYTGTSLLKSSYTMPTLEEVESFTKRNHHLPEVPSAKEIKENGFNLKQMTALLLQKVEELTLYTIEQEKRIKEQDSRIENLEKKLTDKKN